MKLSRRVLTLGILILLLLTIPALSVLQYRWLGEIAESERREMMRSLQRQLNQIRAELAGELAVAREIANLPRGGELVGDQDVWQELESRLDFWRQHARYPDLISEVVIADLDETEQPEFGLTIDGAIGQIAVPLFRSVDGDAPLQRRLPGDATDDPPARRLSAVVTVVLDVDYLYSHVMQSLVESNLAAVGSTAGVDVGLVDLESGETLFSTTAEPIDRADATLEFSPTFLGFGVREPPSSDDAPLPLRSAAFMSWVLRSYPGRPQRPEEITFSFGIDSDQMPSQIFIAGSAAPTWQLVAQYKLGSLDAVVQRTRVRNMSISAGILLVLAGAMVALYVLWHRAESLADRERMFVAGISHEIRTPLAAIYSAGENLAEGIVTDRERVARYGKLIRAEGQRLRSMADEILFFARVQSGNRALESEATDACEVLRRAVSASIRDRGVGEDAVRLSLPEEGVLVWANQAALSLVCENLIVNAIKHNPRGTVVSVTLEQEEEIVRLVVSDNGEGMHRKDVRRATTPFYRGRRAVSDQIPGSGLGLALCDRVVKHYRGRLTIRSSLDIGTTISVILRRGGTEQSEPSAGRNT